ncbi:MAG: protoporphyrinogen oxidase [Bacillota bacterium]
MKRIVIIGGGITGLAAAYVLHKASLKQDIEYLLFERDSRLGGKILTEEVEGFVIEGGPDCFLTEKPQVAQLCRDMGMEDRLLGTYEENKGTFVLAGGKLHQLPEGLMLMVPTKILPFAMSNLISWPGKFRMALDLFIPPKKGEGDESLGSFVRRRLGEEALDKIAEPLVGGVHAGDPEEMSLQASFPRFLDMERKYGSLIRAMLAARKKMPFPTAGGPQRTYFSSLVEGMGELVTALQARLDSERLIAGHGVTGIVKGYGPDGHAVYNVEISGRGVVPADAVIMAVPANEAATLLGEIDPVAANQLAGISLASSATVSLVYRRDELPAFPKSFGFVIPASEKRKIMAVTFTSLKWNRDKDNRYLLLRVFVGGAKNQKLAELPEEEILKLVKEELQAILGITASPRLTRVYRWIKGMPQYTLGHLKRVESIEEGLSRHPGLFIAGGSYRGIGTPDCIHSGTTAAQRALEYLSAVPDEA